MQRLSEAAIEARSMTSVVRRAEASSPCVCCHERASVLAAIYKDTVNCAIWKRDAPFASAPDLVQGAFQGLKIEGIVEVADVSAWLDERLSPAAKILAEDVAYLADMYACLFDVELLGIRLKSLDRAMCPRFHVDKLGCRLLTTYFGAGTEYLDNDDVDRSLVGKASTDPARLPVTDPSTPIHQMSAGAVALAKGEGWPGNEGRGFVHRSPDPGEGYRILLSIDGLSRDA